MVKVRYYRRPKPGEPEKLGMEARTTCLQRENKELTIDMCGVTTHEISRLLEKRGIEHYIVVGYFLTDEIRERMESEDFDIEELDDVGHEWIEFSDGTVLDATADQFDPQFPHVWYPADPSRYQSETKYRGLKARIAGREIEW